MGNGYVNYICSVDYFVSDFMYTWFMKIQKIFIDLLEKRLKIEYVILWKKTQRKPEKKYRKNIRYSGWLNGDLNFL